jgi:hypothetical protein
LPQSDVADIAFEVIGSVTMVLRLPYFKVDVVDRSGKVRPFEIGMALSEPSRMDIEVTVRTSTFDLGQTVC